MKRLCFAAAFSLLLPGAALPQTVDVFDGTWTVATRPDTGGCRRPMEFDLVIEDGAISYGGLWRVDASGTVEPTGAIRLRLQRGDETVTAEGRAAGDKATGRWTSLTRNCTGSWVARRS